MYSAEGGWDDATENYYYIKEWYCINKTGKKIGDTEGILKVYTETGGWAHYYLMGQFLKGKAHGWWDIDDLKNKDVPYQCFYDDG